MSVGRGAEASSAEHQERLSAIAVHLLAIAVAGATLWLVGQPLYANDTWIHLALGEAFAAQGPWLAADPYLYAAPGPPAPSSWLGSTALYGVQSAVGFFGLRAAHVAAVAAHKHECLFALRRVPVLRPQASEHATAALFAVILSPVLIGQQKVAESSPLRAVVPHDQIQEMKKRGSGDKMRGKTLSGMPMAASGAPSSTDLNLGATFAFLL